MQFCSSRTLPGHRYDDQLLERRRRQRQRLFLHVPAKAFDEVARQQRNVAGPVAQRWNRDREHREPEEQIFAEPPRGNGGAQPAIGRRDEPDIDLHRRRAADPLEPLLLERAQNFGLQRQRQIADLVEKERSPVRHLELAGLPGHGAGERALLVAEELGFEQRFGNRRAVDRDKRRVGALAEGVQRAREQLLAGPALALEEHRRIRRRRLLQAGEHFPERQVLADQLRRAATHRELLLQQEVLGHHPPLLERPRDEQGQMIGIDGLGEEIERALLHRRDRILDAAVGGHHDHRRVGVELLRRAQHAEAIAFGKAQVREHDGRALLEHAHGLGLIARFEHGMPLPLERVPEHRTQRVLVFDDQNLGGSGHAGGGQRSQPGGTPALRASSSMSAICFLEVSTSALTFSISWIAWSRSPASFIFW